jgi:general secretion pathway protein C
MQDFLRRNFWTMNLATIAVGSFLCAGLVTEVAAILILKPPPAAAKAPRDLPLTAPKGVKPDPSPAMVATLGDRNLFNCEPPVVEASGENEGEAASDTLDLNVDLLGTLVSNKPDWSLATIRVDGTSKLVRVGVMVAEKAEVVEISGRYIILQAGANQQVVKLWDAKTADKPGATKKPATPMAAAAPAGGDEFAKGVKKTGPNDYQIDRSMLEENLQDLSKLGMQARIVPNYEGGRYAGFRLVGVRPDSLYKAIGMQSGDLIRRINGNEIDTPNKAIELFEQLRSSSSINLDIERRGQKVTMGYQIK